jgi:hypothetical protein
MDRQFPLAVPHNQANQQGQEQDYQHGPEKGQLCWSRIKDGSGKGVVGREPWSLGPRHAVVDKGAEVAEGSRDSRVEV